MRRIVHKVNNENKWVQNFFKIFHNNLILKINNKSLVGLAGLEPAANEL